MHSRPRYISQGVEFYFKVHVHASPLTEPKVCKTCNGSGVRCKGLSLTSYDDDDDSKCRDCSGSGVEYWLDPLFRDTECLEYLQDALDAYLRVKEYKEKQFKELGAGI